MLALVALVLLLVAAPSAQAGAPTLRGAATHPLWSSASAADGVRELDALRDGGANAVRIDLGWATLEEQSKGTRSQWYVDKADAFIAAARQRGIEVIVTFWTTPCWASSAPADVKQNCTGAWWDRGVDRYPPTDPEDYADAAAWVADRWGGDLAALEVWNEPNFSPFFNSAAPASDYAALLKAAYPRVKQEAPGLPVIGPGVLNSDGYFLEDLYDEGAKGYFDGVSSHPFTRSRSPHDPYPPQIAFSYIRGIPWVQEVMAAHGDGHKKQWLTELGWSSCAPTGTSSWCVTLEQQAQYIGDAFRIIRDNWDFVEAAMVYNLRNKGTSPSDRETQMGLLYQDFSPKPSWEAFTTVMDELASWTAPAPDPPPATPDPPPPAPPPGQDAAHIATAPPVPAPAPEALPDPTPALGPLRVRPRRFTVSRRRRVTVVYSLSAPSRLSFTLERRGPAGRFAPVASFGRSGHTGTSSFRLGRRPGGHRLRAGVYRLVAAPSDASGRTGAARRASFRVLRRR
jgi:hypothetical protein